MIEMYPQSGSRGRAAREKTPTTWLQAAALQVGMAILVILSLRPAIAGDFEDAMGALRQGDYRNAVSLLRGAAEKGDPQAQVYLGAMAMEGRAVIRNEAEAMQWFRKAAEHGNAQAQFNLARMYIEGRAVPKNEVEAIKWARKAAEQGNTNAQFALGRSYDRGIGVIKNGSEAVKWFRRAAELGRVDARWCPG